MNPPARALTAALGLLALTAGCTGPSSRRLDSPIPPDSPHDAAAWRIRRYVDEHGQIPPRAWQTALEERERTVAATELLDAGGVSRAAWTERGPINVAGRSRALVIDPTDPQRMFAGSVSGGLWRSTDGGATWTRVNDWWSNLSVPCVTMDPANPDVLYAGTGEGFYSLAHLSRSFSHFVRGAGVMKSTDGGATWAQLPATGSWLHTTRIAVSPTDSNILLASRRPGGIARSIDGGATWTDVAPGEHSFQVLFDPNDGTRAVAHFCATSPLTHGVLTSTDAGATWQPAQSGLTSVTGEGSRIELSYASSSPGVVFASVGSGGGTIWRSTDGGRNWTRRSASGTSTGVGYYYNALWVDPTDENVMVVGALHVWRSIDGGRTFTQITDGYIMTVDPHLDVHHVVADPGYDGAGNRRVYVTTDGGVHVADDIFAAGRGTGWRDLDATMISTQCYAAAGHGSSDVVVGGTQDNGTLRVVGTSRTANLTFGGDGGQVQIDPTDPRYVYGEYQYLGVHRSTNGGASSRTITRGLGDTGSGNSNFIAPLRLDPNDPLRLWVGGRRVWRTTNARASTVGWTAVKPDVGSLVSAIAIAPGLADRVLVGHNDGRLYRANNATSGTPTWIAVDDNGANDPLPDRVVTRLMFDPSNAAVCYATFGGFASDNLWRSNDGGATWQRITGTAPFALPTAPVYGLAVHPDLPDILYAATEVGVFASDDGGAHWTADNDGPANVVAEEITFMHGTRRLVLATLGRGLWTADVELPDARSFGAGCGASTPPRLDLDPLAPARIGKTMRLQCTGLVAGQAFAALLAGLSDQIWNGSNLPLSLAVIGMPNCQLLVSVEGSYSTGIGTGGTASWGMRLPDDRSLLGASLYFQVVAPDPGANATGLGMSNGLATQLGW